MPPCLYICCHLEISNEHNGPPSRPRATSRTLQEGRRTSRRHSGTRERPRERSRGADRQRHRSRHRSQSASETPNYHPLTPPYSTSRTTPPPNHTLTAQKLVVRDQDTRLHLSHKHTHIPHEQAENLQQNLTTTSPRQAKRIYIAKWLQGLKSMSTLSSGSKTKSGSEGESSSVEVVAAKDAKGRRKGIRVVSDEVEEGTGVGGEEREV